MKNFTAKQLTFYLLFTAVSLTTMSNVVAHPGNRNILIKSCADANRVAPVFTADICSTCHVINDKRLWPKKKIAFVNGDLDKFCALKDPNAPDYELYDATAPKLDRNKTVHDIELTAIEKTVVLKQGVTQNLWTYNGTVPGPVIRVKVGDTVRVHFVNPSTNILPHSVDFHASQVAWNDEMTSIYPGEDKMYIWEAEYAGVWMYHCGTNPALHHIASGMYGMVIVEPKEGLRYVDHEFALVQSEYYLHKDMGANMDHAGSGNPSPDYVVFNGIPSQYKENPLQVGTGRSVRIFVSNAGPNQDSSFHIVGTIFNRVIKEGMVLSSHNHGHFGSQAVDLAPSQGAIVEFRTKEDGLYPIVTHAFNFVGKGAIGFIKSGDGNPKN